jgi:hypothetical protein
MGMTQTLNPAEGTSSMSYLTEGDVSQLKAPTMALTHGPEALRVTLSVQDDGRGRKHEMRLRELRQAQLDELHTRAAEMDRNRAVILEQASDGTLKHLMNTAPAHELADSGLSGRALRNELLRRELGQYLTPHCAVVCGVTGTEDCPTC